MHKVSIALVPSTAVPGRFSVRALVLTASVAFLAGLLLPASGGAGSGSQLRQRADRLRGENSTLATRSRSAVVELYALESRLSAAQARVASLRTQSLAVQREQASARQHLAIVHRVLAVSQQHLRARLVELYEGDEPHGTLAIFLGAQSLGDVVTRLDHLGNFAAQDRTMIREAHTARLSLRKLTRSLATRASRLKELESSAAAAAASLKSARQDRLGYIAGLRSQQRLNASQISSLDRQASEADARAHELAAQQAVSPPPAPVQAPAPSGGARAMTVVSTAYALTGTTATGIPVGPGIVAVDPTVIPLGTRMTIPGYGEGVAADTGSAIQGAMIDVWVPTEAQAIIWGRKTLTIYLH